MLTRTHFFNLQKCNQGLQWERHFLLSSTQGDFTLRKRHKRFFWFIITLSFLCFLVSLPTFPADFTFMGKKVTSIGGPDLRIPKIEPVIDVLIGNKESLTESDYLINKELKAHLGLDLQGGTQLTLDVDMTNVPAKDRDSVLTGVYNVIERRVNAFGVSESVIQKSVTGTGEHRILVELPGIQNLDEAKKLVGKTAQLEFKEFVMEPSTSTDPATASQPKTSLLDTGITGKDFKRAEPQIDQQNQHDTPFLVQFELNDSVKQQFGDLTTRLVAENTTKRLAILLDGEIILNATVQSPIKDGKGIITNMKSIDEAKQLAIQLNAGALPAPISIVDERHLSATLGQDALKKSLFAGILGILTVMLFMVIFYRIPGLISIAALSVYIVITLTLFKLIPVVLTLAGIAGFVLSIGVAVDANILIFERLREELAAGKTISKAVELGFERAWSSIRDSNAATLITCLILYVFGTGVIRGFAVTLALGVFVSLFTAIAVTREFLHRILELRIFRNHKLL